MAGGNATKIGIVVAAVAVAVLVTVLTRAPQTAQFVGDSSQVNLICTKCNDHFGMSLKDYEQAVKAGVKLPSEGGDAGAARGARRGGGKPTMVKCSKCGEMAAVPAVKCPKSDNWYPKANPDGTPGVCPD